VSQVPASAVTGPGWLAARGLALAVSELWPGAVFRGGPDAGSGEVLTRVRGEAAEGHAWAAACSRARVPSSRLWAVVYGGAEGRDGVLA
jgi:hypothetical protein